jgi:hypothetical protein
MASVPSELDSFCDFLDGLRQEPCAELSPEEAVAQWRAQQMTPEELQESVAAIREAIADMEAGEEGMPFDEFVSKMRQKYNLSPNA